MFVTFSGISGLVASVRDKTPRPSWIFSFSSTIFSDSFDLISVSTVFFSNLSSF